MPEASDRTSPGGGSIASSNQADTAVASPDNNQNAPLGDPRTPRQQRRTFLATLKNIMFNMMMAWLLMRYFFPGGQRGAVRESKIKTSPCLFEPDFPMDLYAYVSEDSFEPDFFNPKELKWVQKNLIFGNWNQGPNGDSTYQKEFDIDLSPKVQRNGSIWLHVYFVQSGYIPFEATRAAENYSPTYTIHRKKQLNRFKKRRYRETHNLITGKTEKSEEEIEKIKNKIHEEIVSHWHPNLTINMIYDHHATWTQGSIPAPFDEYIDFEPISGRYYPIVFLNDYWNLLRDYQPINETVKTVQLSLTYQPLSSFKWQLYATQGMRNKWSNMLGVEAQENDEEQDYVKQALLETSPILLGLTAAVMISHSVFEFLAFKNDIQFWRDRKSLEGLSVRSVFFNLFQSLVVLLYVLDNDTNTLIRISIGIGLLIELWKIPKVVNIRVDRDRKIFGLIPRISLEDKGSYVESSTKQYDLLAYKYLSWVVFPLFIAYGIYSLLYLEHKGWYSFILNMTYGFLLAFGFIMMTPQLFINYKLKSVAHLPWRMLSYKFLNTFIDDMFAFIIQMPWMYRLGTLRDDVIFIIYLYQRWIYRVDPKRVNEFGVSGDQLQEREGRQADASSENPVEGSETPALPPTDSTSSTSEPKATSTKKSRKDKTD